MEPGDAVPAEFHDLRDALIDRYDLLRVVGSGGGATVLLARDLKLPRLVTLKVLRRELMDIIGEAEFLHEIAVVARLKHPSILPIFDSDEAAGRLYFVTPYATGKSLRAEVSGSSGLPARKALRIAGQIADALDHAHGQNVLHRDVKPENILFEGGRAMLSDFGISRLLAAESADWDEGAIRGTPWYMAPEQLDPESDADPRSDIYSLGCVLFEMLAGRRPFARAQRLGELYAQKLGGTTESVRDHQPDIPKSIDRLVLRAMSPLPEDRFSTAREFSTALAAASQSLSEPDRFEGPWRWATLALVAAGVGGILMMGDGHRDIPDGLDRRVAVAVFQNGTGDPGLDALGVMAADWITQGIQSTGVAGVVPTPTALRASRFAQGLDMSPARADLVQTLADETAAGIVVTGSYYLMGDSLSFQVQVSDVTAGALLGSVSDERAPVSDPVSAIERLRGRVMGLLAVQVDDRLAPEAYHGRAPPLFAAYRFFSSGLDQYLASDYSAASDAFEAAFRADSTFLVPLIFASTSRSNLGQFARADSILRIVGRRRSELGAYHQHWLDYRRAFLDGDLPAAHRAIGEAARLAPGSRAVYNRAVSAYELGRPREAVETLETLTAERGPMRGWAPYWWLLATSYHQLGEQDLEVAVVQQARELYSDRLSTIELRVRLAAASGDVEEVDGLMYEARVLEPDYANDDFVFILLVGAEELRIHGYAAAAAELLRTQVTRLDSARVANDGGASRWSRARVLYALGRWREALPLARALRDADPQNPDYLGLLGRLLARLDDLDGARAVAAELTRMDRPFDFGQTLRQRAKIAGAAGNHEEALGLLREGVASGLPLGIWLHHDEDLSGARELPGFRSLVAGDGG